jgi:diguanylate cyclase (GGDEF)-like protein
MSDLQMLSPVLAKTKPFTSLEESLDALVKCLRLIVPFQIWMVNRLSGDDLCALYVDDSKSELATGTVFSWSDSYCKQMVAGLGPSFAEDAQSIQVYREAPCNRIMPVGAYISNPLTAEDGTLLGTLCAVDPIAQPSLSEAQQQLVVHLTRTMSTLICTWLKVEDSRRSEARLRYQAHTDGLTKLANRYAWESVIEEEERALAHHGGNAMVVMIDLDGLKCINDTYGHAEGDKHLVKASAVLREQIRENDVAARIGGDEFSLLIRDVTKEEGARLHTRIKEAFRESDVIASVGYAMRLSHGSLNDALREADALMYQAKTLRKRELFRENKV